MTKNSMAKTVEHTPGPWRVEESSHKQEFSHWIGPFSRYGVPPQSTIAAIVNAAESRANASLIGAAPDLLEALKLIVAEPYGCPMCDSGKLRNPDKQHWPKCGFASARVAIMKAEQIATVDPQ